MDIRFIIGLIGSILLVSGAATTAKSKNTLFALGNAGMFVYSLLGYLQGGPIFFLILQLFVATSTLCMLFNVPDKYDTLLLAISGLGLIAWSLSLFEGYSTTIFVFGLALLGIGFATDFGTIKREFAFLVGSALIGIFAFLMRDWVFTWLNVVFTVLSLINILRIAQRK